MKQTQLEVDMNKYITEITSKIVKDLKYQLVNFENLLISKMTENYRYVDKDRTKELFTFCFTNRASKEIDALFEHYKSSEIEFYSKTLKTADLIFNELTDKRTKIIYLENLIKKIDEKEVELDKVFDESARNKFREEKKPDNVSINDMFETFMMLVSKNPKLSKEDIKELTLLSDNYFKLYKNGMVSTLKSYFDTNKKIAIYKIDEATDVSQIRDGKTSATARKERMITNDILKLMDEILSTTITKHKNVAKEQLGKFSSSTVDLIFKLLPPEYHAQKNLLEVIVDTNINERLSKLLDTESKKLFINLNDENTDSIENELYEEKIYNETNDYDCNFELVTKVYKDVLNEIKLAYDIPENQLERLNLMILNESNFTKVVFKSFTSKVILENKKNLKTVIDKMHQDIKKSSDEEVKQKSKSNNI